MKQIAYLSAFAASLLLADVAAAQAPGSTPAPADPAPPAATQGWDGAQKWGIGLRTVSRAMRDVDAPDDAEPTALGGGGIQVRYRMSARWEFEVAIEGASAELFDGALTRSSSGATLSAIYRMRPYRNWDWYLLAGIGGSEERFERTNKVGIDDEVFSQGHAQLGIGLERRFRRFGIGAELRAIGAGLDREQGNAPDYMEGAAPIPEESSGGQLNITATYYF